MLPGKIRRGVTVTPPPLVGQGLIIIAVKRRRTYQKWHINIVWKCWNTRIEQNFFKTFRFYWPTLYCYNNETMLGYSPWQYFTRRWLITPWVISMTGVSIHLQLFQYYQYERHFPTTDLFARRYQIHMSNDTYKAVSLKETVVKFYFR